MKKLILISLMAAILQITLAQSIYNNGARIVSTTGSYWVVDNDGFALNSTSPSNLAQFHNLTIGSDASLTLGTSSTPSYLTVSGTLDNNSGTDGLIINKGSSLIENSGAEATVNVEITNDAWHFIASPVASAYSGMFEGEYLQTFNETTGSYVEITTLEYLLNPVQGFGFWSEDGGTDYTFSGSLNTGAPSRSITCTPVVGDDNDGANLLGNPYPSYIDWAEVDISYGYGAVYYWNGAAFVAYPASGFGLGSQYIPPMQGFFIVVGAGGTFNLEYADRTHATAGFYKSEQDLKDYQAMILYADNGSLKDRLILRFDVEATENFEQVRDAWKMTSNTPGLSQLWTQCSSGNLCIDVRPETDVVQLGFDNDQNGHYSIGISQSNGFSQAILEDTQLNVFHNLDLGVYSFDWTTSDSKNRFKLHLQATGTEDLEAQEAQVYVSQGLVYVNCPENLFDEITFFDLAGRTIYKSPLNGPGMQTFDLKEPTGAYLVNLSGNKATETHKIIVKR